MKASEIKPSSWGFGLGNPKVNILMRKWENTKKNVVHMEEAMLALMQNSAATPEQLSAAAKLYVSTTEQLHNSAKMIDDYLYHGIKPKPLGHHMLSCGATRTGKEENCNCADWKGGME